MAEENNLKNKTVHTLAEDMAKAIESGQGGVIKNIIHEQEEREVEKINLSPESQKNKLFMIISIALLFSALAILVFFAFFKKEIFTLQVPPQFIPLIFTDKTEFREVAGLNKDKIAQTVRNEVMATKVKTGGVEGIYLTENKKIIGLRGFIALIKAGLNPEQIVFADDNFLLGAVNRDAKSLFILIKVRSFADIFDGMKAWENKMFYDLHGFFGIDISADTNYLLTKDFEDGVIENKNARILYDKLGNIVFMYIFADDTSVIITNTEEAAREVVLRLAGSQIRK